ncbi:conjugative transposon protein TraM [Pedobacter panaciterrae]|uniref:conjugative transposon protein TraM n=1 Tax=Pedobacter panaciterrae TaxID=363849 RepID=UPI00155D9B3F|nr:conjugative transposon protein TraM [Pedobacter panaciterrae]NQX54476.1 conjugative transposon protein TraM [Pedobacter panaciterrae]
MSRIKLNQPKYIIPIIVLPFLLLFFYVYQLTIGYPAPELSAKEGIQDHIGNVSPEVQKKELEDKLDAFNQQYKEADGNTAVNPIEDVQGLDSIDLMMKQRFMAGGPIAGSSIGMNPVMSQQDQQLAQALAALQKGSPPAVAGGYQPSNPYGSYTQPAPVYQPPAVKEKDPMDLFKAQMKYMDSVSKTSDPEYQAEVKRQALVDKAELARKNTPKLSVQKEASYSEVFNTVKPGKTDNFITAIIDENITGYAGSRIRLRLLEDIRAGKFLVRKGTYLYALITGFGDQRVTLGVKSILQDGKILPVKLELYDTDGLPGLYVPESAFREFSKDLGGNSMQGVNLQGNSTDANQFLMSSLDKMFQSTSSAIASLIRRNKAKVKYNSYIYLIDPEELQKTQQEY